MVEVPVLWPCVCCLEMLGPGTDSCTRIKVKATKQGHTELMAVYEHGKVRLSATVTIAAYNPLKVGH